MSIKQLPKRVLWKVKEKHWIYMLIHLVLFIIGLLAVMYGNTIISTTKGLAFVSIGGSIIATGIAGWVLFLYVWLSQDEFYRMEIIRKFGLIHAFETRSVRIKQEYDIRLDHASDAIDIMGFGLKALREDYNKDFGKWAKRAKVRILLLDPEFPNAEWNIANQRDKEETDDQGAINREVRAFIRGSGELIKAEQKNFKIRLYRCLPSINIFRIDDNIFWGPYLIGGVSRNFPTFIVDQQGILYKRLSDHFDKIWSSETFSRDVPNEWLEPNEKTS